MKVVFYNLVAAAIHPMYVKVRVCGSEFLSQLFATLADEILRSPNITTTGADWAFRQARAFLIIAGPFSLPPARNHGA